MSFLYPFLNFLQPGILWPELADLRPMLVASVIGLLAGWMRRAEFSRSQAFGGKVFVYLILFLCVQVLSLYYTGLLGMLGELVFWYVFALFVAISILLMSDVTAIKRYVWGMMLGGMVVVAYGIYAVPAWGGYIHSGRAGAYGMYENHNDYSFIIIQIIPFLYMYMRFDKGFFRRLLLAGSLGACGVGMAMSLSRGGMIALVIEAALIIMIGMEGKRRFLLLPVLALVGALAITYQYAKRAENQGAGYTAEDAESGRFELWKAGIRMLQHHPFLGVGSRRFAEYSSDYYDLSHDMRGKVSHNTYVEVFAGSGFLGIGAFLAAFYYLIRDLRKRPRVHGPPILDATRKATLIAILAILVRAFLDAKPHDWSLYTLCAIGIACCCLQRRLDLAATQDNGVGSETAPAASDLPALALKY